LQRRLSHRGFEDAEMLMTFGGLFLLMLVVMVSCGGKLPRNLC
jgi:hypothetical protein